MKLGRQQAVPNSSNILIELCDRHTWGGSNRNQAAQGYTRDGTSADCPLLLNENIPISSAPVPVSVYRTDASSSETCSKSPLRVSIAGTLAGDLPTPTVDLIPNKRTKLARKYDGVTGATARGRDQAEAEILGTNGRSRRRPRPR